MSSVEPELEAAKLEAITELDSQIEISHLTNNQSSLALLESGRDDDVEDGRRLSRVPHDLAPVHNVLVNLAESLQLKVDNTIKELMEIRVKLATEMMNTADMLSSLGEIKLGSSLSSSMSVSPSSSASQAILSIHQYRDLAVSRLRAQAEILSHNKVPASQGDTVSEDFNNASDQLDGSFQHLRSWLDQIGQAARQLQHCDNQSNTIRKFSVEKCRDIDALEREAVMEKMGELSIRNCSIQSRKPVRSLGHTLDLQEIMLLAKNAKSLVYEVSLQMLKMVDLVKGEEISATSTYHSLTKENSELLRRYCFYLKLKIQQL